MLIHVWLRPGQDGSSPVSIAYSRGHVKIARMLMDMGAVLEQQVGALCCAVLEYARTYQEL
jgi:hypothetical protein